MTPDTRVPGGAEQAAQAAAEPRSARTVPRGAYRRFAAVRSAGISLPASSYAFLIAAIAGPPYSRFFDREPGERMV